MAQNAATNAPRHWPRIEVATWAVDTPAPVYLQISATLAQAFGDQAALRFRYDLLYEDGIVRLPLLIDENGKTTAIFAYLKADAAAAAHYSGVRALLRQREQMNAVYYAPQPIAPAPPGPAVEPLDSPHFGKVDVERAPAEYALWWPTPEDPRLADSPALASLDTWFQSLDGYASYLFSSYVRVLELVDPHHQGMFALPGDAWLTPINGPADMEMYLHASMSQGLWMAFHATHTDAGRRNLLLKLMAESAADFRAAALQQNVPKMPDERGQCLDFWKRARADALKKESEGAEALRVGRIAEEEGTRTLFAGATSAADRTPRPQAAPAPPPPVAAAPTSPPAPTPAPAAPAAPVAAPLQNAPMSPAVFEFAEQTRDQTLRWITTSDPTGMELYQEGAPLFSPALHVLAPDGLHMTRFMMATTADALAGAPRALAGSPAASVAALVSDEITNVNGRPGHELNVLVQRREDAHAFLFRQRYDTPKATRPFSILGGLESLGPRAPFFPPPGAAAPAPAPAPAPAAATPTPAVIAAPAALPLDAAAIEAERRRIELTRATQNASASISRVGGARTGFKATRQGEEAVDVLRFVAFRAEPHPGGLRLAYKAMASREVTWASVESITVRQLPGDPPWNLAFVIDFGLVAESAPIRLLTGTFIGFKALPGGASTSPMENVRKLCRYALEQNPAITMEEPTQRFLIEGAPCPRFASMRQFAEYDAQYT